MKCIEKFYKYFVKTLPKFEGCQTFVTNEILGISLEIDIQWNLSKADTYGTEVFVRFREVSTLERFELKSSQI